MKISIITCFESDEERVGFLYKLFRNKGYETKVYTTDFSHALKKKRNNIPDGYISIDTKPYYKNLSLDRILSHAQFAKDVFDTIDDDNDILWIMAPANSLIKKAYEYKKNHKVKIIIDIIDMWPESLPISINKNIFPFNIWKNIRSKYISCADVLVSECNMYKSILSKEYKGNIHTLYWAKDYDNPRNKKQLNNDHLELCYIGSINNIIDIDKICGVISKIDKKVTVHIIGDGERKDEFINRLNEICEVIYHGVIYDNNQKNEIFDKCHGGINIYKDGLYIGLTTKCIDYFGGGLPIINNIKADTHDLINEYNAGINIDDSDMDIDRLIDISNNNETVFELFDKNFSRNAFNKKVESILKEAI